MAGAILLQTAQKNAGRERLAGRFRAEPELVGVTSLGPERRGLQLTRESPLERQGPLGKRIGAPG